MFLTLDFFNNFCRNATYQGIVWNIFSYYRSRSNHYTITNGYARANCTMSPNPNIISNFYWLTNSQSFPPTFDCKWVVNRINISIKSNPNIIANLNWCNIKDS